MYEEWGRREGMILQEQTHIGIKVYIKYIFKVGQKRCFRSRLTASPLFFGPIYSLNLHDMREILYTSMDFAALN